VNCGCEGSAAELRFAQPREHFQKKNAQGPMTLGVKRESPQVSVVLCTKDRLDDLPVALHSLCVQTFDNFEAIIVNDGGADPLPVIAPFLDRLTIRYINHNVSCGIARSRNAALMAARGKYIAYLDDDDYYYEEHLNILYTNLERTGCYVAYTDALCAEQRKRDNRFETLSRTLIYSHEFNKNSFLEMNITPTLCIMHHIECVYFTGVFRWYLDRCEDWELWQRMSRFYVFMHIPNVTCVYTLRIEFESLSKDRKSIDESSDFVRFLGGLLKKMPRMGDIAAYTEKAKYLASSSRALYPLSVVIHLPGHSQHFDSLIQYLKEIPADSAEIILVVDEASDDHLKNLQENAGENMTVAVWSRPIGRMLACHEGGKLAKGRKVFFLSANILPDRDCMRGILDYWSSTDDSDRVWCLFHASVSGIEEMPARMGKSGNLPEMRKMRIPQGMERELFLKNGLAMAGLMLPNSLFKRFDGFRIRFAGTCWEWADLALLAAQKGVPVFAGGFSPDGKKQDEKKCGCAAGDLYGEIIFRSEWSLKFDYRAVTHDVQPAGDERACVCPARGPAPESRQRNQRKEPPGTGNSPVGRLLHKQPVSSIRHVGLYHWRESGGKGNLGDELSPYLVEKISGRKPAYSPPDSPQKICAIGSLLDALTLESGGIFWGTGTHHAVLPPSTTAGVVSFRAVRGPVTRKILRAHGYICPAIYGDPAL
jgi:glycosyltransferase involved in cell wall biosynthesis